MHPVFLIWLVKNAVLTGLECTWYSDRNGKCVMIRTASGAPLNDEDTEQYLPIVRAEAERWNIKLRTEKLPFGLLICEE